MKMRNEILNSLESIINKEEKHLNELNAFASEVADFLGLDPIPVVVEEMSQDSRLYLKEQYIAISEVTAKDKIESMKAVAHELRHLFQIVVVAYKIDELPLFEEYKKELSESKRSDEDDVTAYNMKLIEIDANAFAKYILREKYDIITNHENETYDNLLNTFIEKYIQE